MKIKKWLMLAAPVALTIGTMPVALTACGSYEDLGKCPEITKVETRTCPYYQANFLDPWGLFFTGYSKVGININVTEFNGETIPYIDLDENLQVFKNLYSASTSDYKTVITSLYNYDWCIIDYKKQTITFSDYNAFVDRDTDSVGPLTAGCGGGYNYYHDVTVNEYRNGGAQVIDLSYYNLKAYYYQDNVAGSKPHGFIPYHLLHNIFNIDFVNAMCDYNGYGMYEMPGGDVDGVIDAMKAVKAAARDGFYNAKYMEYCYNLLALTLDCKWGLTQRMSRANPGQVINYCPKGAYSMLSKYHDRLVSTEADVSSDALREIYSKELDDGGHAGYHNLNVFSTKSFPAGADVGAETAITDARATAMVNARANKGIAPSEKHDNAIGDYTEYEKDGEKIAYVTFDGFEYEAGLTKEEAEIGKQTGKPRELPEYTTDDNYFLDLFRLTMYANKKIKADSSIKNVVVDITCNGGGAVCTEHFIASWLLGGVTEKIYDPVTGGYCEYTVKADVNGDGKFDSDDYISDVNLYVITSGFSFSCGNMLPCNVADHTSQRSGKTKIIGARSGGGACFVDEMMLGAGTYSRSSSTYHMLRKSSKYGKYDSVDSGAPITSGWEWDEINHPEVFFDRAAINELIWKDK